ncbi:MAG: tRNA (5-methylaminomethyl-2-thiouridine)(34)-methyltransferase MnmD [Pseudomonadota bacterium]
MYATPERSPAWSDGNVPISRRYDDPYYSRENGLAESRHVFLGGNDLPDRFCEGFRIAELGFGTGLNLMAAWIAWRGSGQKAPLHYVSFEANPLEARDLARALSAFPEVEPLVPALLSAYREGREDVAADLRLTLVIGDARAYVPRMTKPADAWFLDGFSPAKNSEMWDAPLLRAVAEHTRKGGTAATYTAAGFVRRNLEDAGFTVTRAPGYGRKRHMTRACLA